MTFGGGGGSGSIHTDSDVALNNPADGDVLAYNATLAKWENAPASGGGGNVSASESLTYFGTLTTGTGAIPLYNDSGSDRTITSVRASVGTAPTGAAVIVDVNVNGSSIFPTQSEQPTIADGTVTSGAVSRSASWPNGQGITVDVDQVGSSVAGADLIVTLEYQ